MGGVVGGVVFSDRKALFLILPVQERRREPGSRHSCQKDLHPHGLLKRRSEGSKKV